METERKISRQESEASQWGRDKKSAEVIPNLAKQMGNQAFLQRMAGGETTSLGINTGIPQDIKTRVENKSGLSMDSVNVHYQSSKPAQVGALAYTKGTDVFLGPGQEKHLSHELGHVVQQMQGRVKATGQVSGQPLNDDAALEREADGFR